MMESQTKWDQLSVFISDHIRHGSFFMFPRNRHPHRKHHHVHCDGLRCSSRPPAGRIVEVQVANANTHPPRLDRIC
eukprot:scaffold2679_cov224-Ochromonas_danica.AAC.2